MEFLLYHHLLKYFIFLQYFIQRVHICFLNLSFLSFVTLSFNLPSLLILTFLMFNFYPFLQFLMLIHLSQIIKFILLFLIFLIIFIILSVPTPIILINFSVLTIIIQIILALLFLNYLYHLISLNFSSMIPVFLQSCLIRPPLVPYYSSLRLFHLFNCSLILQIQPLIQNLII